MTRLFKIFTANQWAAFEADGVFAGSADDLRDGFIHLSAEAQVHGTLEKHFAGVSGLIIAEVDAAALGPALKWAESRGGQLFPHLYAPLLMSTVSGFSPHPVES